MSMQLFSAPTPNGWKVSIMLEELREAGVELTDCSLETVDITQGEQFSESFTQVCPNQKIPALRDGDITLMESCAILQYLAEKYPQAGLLPGNEKRWEVLQWLYWQAANIGPAFGNKLAYTRYLSDVDETLKAHPLERFDKEARRLADVLNTQLAGQDYVCGQDFSIADIALFPWLRAWKWSKVDISEHSHILNWIERVRSRPGVARGVAYGMPASEVDKMSPERRKHYQQAGSELKRAKTMSSKELSFYFDYISPNAYIAWRQLPQLIQRHQITVKPVPVLFTGLLRAHGQMGPAEIPAKRRWMHENIVRKAVMLNIPLSPPKHHPFNPLLSLRASSADMDDDQRWRLIDAFMDGVWAKGMHPSDIEDVRKILLQADLDPDKILPQAQSTAVKDRLFTQTEEAIAKGVFGIPSICHEQSLFFGYDDFPFLEMALEGKDPAQHSEMAKAWLEGQYTASSGRKETASKPSSHRE